MSSPILEVVIGIILIYLVLSMICSAISEIVALALDARARFLWKAIGKLLKDPQSKNLALDVYKHPLIRSLSVKDDGIESYDKVKDRPSYIPASFFAMALTDNLGFGGCTAPTKPLSDTVKTKIEATSSQLGEEEDAAKAAAAEVERKKQQVALLSPLIDSACDNVDQARKNIEIWYDSAMQRATGLYKRKTQWMLLLIGILVAFLGNADSLMLTRRLWENPAERAALGAVARDLVKTPGTPTPGNETGITDEAFEKAKAATDSLLGWSGPVGWVDDPLYDKNDPRRFPRGDEYWMKLLGLLITAGAISYGAPFWFDLLKKFVNPRSVGASPTDPKQQLGRIGQGS